MSKGEKLPGRSPHSYKVPDFVRILSTRIEGIIASTRQQVIFLVIITDGKKHEKIMLRIIAGEKVDETEVVGLHNGAKELSSVLARHQLDYAEKYVRALLSGIDGPSFHSSAQNAGTTRPPAQSSGMKRRKK